MTVTGPNGETHPAWGTSYDIKTNTATPMWVTSNTFCAGGFTLGNGQYAVFGGNQPVTTDGVAVNDKGKNPTGANPYGNTDGGEAIRVITPCDDGNCQWIEGGDDLTMTVSFHHPVPTELTCRANVGTPPSRVLEMDPSSSLEETRTEVTFQPKSKTTPPMNSTPNKVKKSTWIS